MLKPSATGVHRRDRRQHQDGAAQRSMSTGRSIDWPCTARALEDHHFRKPAYATMEWSHPSSFDGPMNGPTFLTYIQQCLVPTIGRRDTVIMDNLAAHAPAISAAVFARLQSNRTGLQQSEITSAQGSRANNRRTLSQNRLDCPLLQSPRMCKFLRACGVWVNMSGYALAPPEY